MTFSDPEQDHRDKMDRRRRGEDDRKPAKASGKRFEFQNALVRSGLLGKLTGLEVKVLFVLNTQADNALKVRMGHTAISTAVGTRREKAAKTTRALERKGFIRCTSRGRTYGASGKRHTNEYRLLSDLPNLISAAGGTNELLD